MSSNTDANEFETPSVRQPETVTAQGTGNVAIGGNANDSTIVTGDGNQIGHRVGGDLVVGNKTTVTNYVSLKWLLPLLFIIAAGVSVIAWQSSRATLQQGNQVVTPLSSPSPMASTLVATTPSPTPAPSATVTTNRKKPPAEKENGVVIVEQKVKEN